MDPGLRAISDDELVLVDRGDFGGRGYTEAPVWHPQGYLTFVRHRLDRLYRFDPTSGEVAIIRENTLHMNGRALDPNGRMFCCEGESCRLTRIDPGEQGAASAEGWPKDTVIVVDTFEGKKFNRPNDVTVRSDGRVYFTDPSKPSKDPETDKQHVGRPMVYCVAPDGALSVATDECEHPNGLVFSPDESILYVNITRRDEGCGEESPCPHRKIRMFDVAADGSLHNNRVFVEVTSAGKAGPDGMTVDRDGRVYCSSDLGVWVFEPNGTLLGVIETGDNSRNVAFGGENLDVLYICAGEHLYSLQTKVRGIDLLCSA